MATEWRIRQEICEIGRRLYARQFAAGNDGNISYRLSQNVVLCSPTQICKGFMRPEDLCTVDLDANQLSGKRKRTSEIRLHLEIYKHDPAVKAVVHCHPPHATAFGVAQVDIPTCILPEAEVFLGVVPRAAYETPGGQHFAETIRPFIGKANTVVLSNHGTVSWGPTLERAYWNTEILDSYCRVLLLAKQVGNVTRLPEPKVSELLDLRAAFGAGEDSRLKDGGQMCVNTTFGRSGGAGAAPAGAPVATPTTPTPSPQSRDALVQAITARVLAALRSQSSSS
jgi:L-fuculose-phosphate aldolase